jgi:hypothetical protein
MDEPRREQVEDVERREDVRVALQQVAGPRPEKEPVAPLQLAWVATYILLLAGLAVVLYLLRFDVFPLSPRADALLQRLTLGAMAVVAILAAAKALDTLVLSRLED